MTSKKRLYINFTIFWFQLVSPDDVVNSAKLFGTLNLPHRFVVIFIYLFCFIFNCVVSQYSICRRYVVRIWTSLRLLFWIGVFQFLFRKRLKPFLFQAFLFFLWAFLVDMRFTNNRAVGMRGQFLLLPTTFAGFTKGTLTHWKGYYYKDLTSAHSQ